MRSRRSLRRAPDIYNHNLETVPRSISGSARARATSIRIRLLQRVKELAPRMFTKSGIMVGLGESARRCCK